MMKPPASIAEQSRWLLWREESREGKMTKVPYQAHSPTAKAAVDNPSTWADCETARAALQSSGCNGLGFVLGEGIVGLDLDHVCDAATGHIQPWAWQLIKRLNSYAEFSPSGTGVHVLMRGSIPPGLNRVGAIELYADGRFFTITGKGLYNSPLDLQERTPQLAALHADLVLLKGFSDWGKRVNAEKIAALLAGKADGYPSDSERDLALAGYLVRWADGKMDQADRVFRLTGCYREKWERADYRERTLAKALESVPPAAQPESHTATQVSEPQPAPADALPQVAPDVLDRIARLHPTDAGNAEAFALLFGEGVRFDHKQKRWLVWGQHRWLSDADALVDRLALQTVRVRYQAAATIPHDEQRRSAVKWALDSESHRRRQDLLASARSLPPIADDGLNWDCDLWLLGCENGVLELRAGTLRPGSPEDRITKTTGIAYDPEAECPRWEQFLQEIMLGYAVLVHYLRRIVGYTLTGLTAEQCLFLLFGTGANGKTTLVETLLALSGDYGTKTAFDSFLRRREESETRHDLATLEGKRLVVATEAPKGKALAEVVVKEITGGDTIRARHLYRDSFQFKPQAKLFLAANHKPTIHGTDEAIWRRIRLIPFVFTVPEHQRDPRLLEKLRAELPGILNWALTGCLEWQREGLQTPEEVRAATEGYRAEQDLIGAFLADSTVEDETASTPVSLLYNAYAAWAQAAGEEACPQRTFTQTLAERGFERARKTQDGARPWQWLGLRLTGGVEDVQA